MPIPRFRHAAACLVLLALALGPLHAAGQTLSWPALPGLPKPPAAAAPASAAASEPASAASDEALRARLQQDLEDARTLSAALAGGAAVPPGVSDDEVAVASRKLSQWIFALEGQLRALDGIARARVEKEEATAANAAWTGFPDKPPYSILRAEELGQQVDALTARIQAAGASQTVSGREFERLQQDIQRSAEAQRRAEEAARARPADLVAAWRARAAAWTANGAGATAAAVARAKELSDISVEADTQRLRLLERQLQTVQAHISFTEADLQQVRRTEQGRQARLDKAAAAARALADNRTREAGAAERALQALRVATPPAAPARLDAAESQLRALNAAVDTARRDSEVQAALSSLSSTMVEMWQLRFDALNAADAARRQAAADSLHEMLRSLQVWRSFATSQIDLVQSDQAEQALQQERVAGVPELLLHESARSESLRQRALSVQQLLDQIGRDQHTLERWLADIGLDREQRSWQDKAAAFWARTVAVFRTIWGFELFSVEDTLEVQGQKITTTRGVSVGKSIGALLIFLVGYFAASRLARRLERELHTRFGIGAQQARTIRRWTMAAVGFVLLVLTLNLAQIPLTVFAFLGGALAIGVGFGTQTIIKNFISGLILLLERQVRVGDAVEIDGFAGTVAEVNLRSSTIIGYDGADAIIPNSALLEGRVTNLTMSSRNVRRTLKVGVAYGSPTRKVADLIRECAERHGQVLKQPPPRVLLDEFGDSALIFALYIWIDVKTSPGGPVITSDLRFMIEAALSEAGISIAFPQRDIRLDTTRPLEVKISRGAPPTSAA